MAGVAAAFQKRAFEGNAWKTVKSAKTDPKGRAKFEFKAEKGVSYRYTVPSLGCTSKLMTVQVE